MQKQLLRLINILAILLLLNCSRGSEQLNTEIMYFVLIDRFVDGDPSNNLGHNPESFLAYDGTNPEALSHYQGGDIAGVHQSLDHLKSLGVTMVWISPFLDNSNTDYVGWWPYHGYHPIDFYKVDEHFGTLAELKALVEAAHQRDMKIIFDMPFNQTAPDHPWITDAGKADWYHVGEDGQPLEITNWFDQDQIENGELHGLPDLAQENPEVRDYLIDVSKFWIDETGCDGFRLDAVKHISKAFWASYNAVIKAYTDPDFLLFGEVFWGEPERIEPYLDLGFDLLFDIPGYYAVRNTFSKGSPIQSFSQFFWEAEGRLGGTQQATLIDNHDVARFNVGLGEDAWSRQMLALGWLMTRPGLPVIYYGTELGMPGYPVISASGEPQDFLNRLPFPETLSPEQVKREAEFRSLTTLRHAHPSLSHGEFIEVYKDWSVYAYLRMTAEDQLLIVLNNAGTEEFVPIPLPPELVEAAPEKIYGRASLREENNAWWMRLPATSLSVWKLEDIQYDQIQTMATFTDRLSKDYRPITLFALDPEKQIQTLQLAGDFNAWQAEDYETHRQGDTLFVTIPLRPGNYQYKFVLNGTSWEANPLAEDFVVDPYGGQNSLLSVK